MNSDRKSGGKGAKNFFGIFSKTFAKPLDNLTEIVYNLCVVKLTGRPEGKAHARVAELADAHV